MCICFLCVYICVHVCHKCVGVFGSRKRVSDLLKQHLQAVVIIVYGKQLFPPKIALLIFSYFSHSEC